MRPLPWWCVGVGVLVGLVWLAGALAGSAGLPQQGGLVSLLDQANVTIRGAAADDGVGWSVAAAGNVNGDGRPDVIVGAPFASVNGKMSGAAWVIFGQSRPTTVTLSYVGLPPSEGFLIKGAAVGDQAGYSVSGAGDVNHDGFADVIVGAPYAAGLVPGSGYAYVLFGGSSPSTVTLSNNALPASVGFLINGVAAGDKAGWSVGGAGDLNHAGFADVIVGAPAANATGAHSGAAYVVFGRKSAATVNLSNTGLASSDGFLIKGAAAGNQAGESVAGAGDVNGDGFPDVIVGAPQAAGLVPGSGNAYVVFGKSSPTTVTLSNNALPASEGFLINGVAAGDHAGWSVAGAGDVNGDGLADVIVGAPFASTNGQATGAAYVVFGRKSAATVNLSNSGLAASDGFLLKGAAANDYAGYSVAGAGDVNGDGRADVIVGAPAPEPIGKSVGNAYVVFGQSSPATVNLSNIGRPASNGFLIQGAAGDLAGWSVAGAGDVNGDGRADVIVGAARAQGNVPSSGAAYEVFGFGPASLSYGLLQGVQGKPIGKLAPVFKVGAGVPTFAVSPALPSGLALDPKTGVVSGTPTAAATATYTVSLSDLTGMISAPLKISIRATPPPPVTPPEAPKITAATLTHTRFHAAAKGAAKPIGTSFQITLSADANLAITITSKRQGLRKGAACVTPTPSLRKSHAAHCTRLITPGTITHANATHGLTTIQFNGHLQGHTLQPGSYTARLTAANTNGSATPKTLNFTILAA